MLVLATLAGIWLFHDRNGVNTLLGPATVTPSPVASPTCPCTAATRLAPWPPWSALLALPLNSGKLQTGEPVNLGAAVVDSVDPPVGSKGFEARDALTGRPALGLHTTRLPFPRRPWSNGLGYVIDADATLYAVNISEGTEARRMANYQRRHSVAPVDDLVYAVSPEGTSSLLDASTGAIIWQADTGAESGRRHGRRRWYRLPGQSRRPDVRLRRQDRRATLDLPE